MHIKPFQALYPKLDYITSIDSFISSIKEEYNEYHASGFFEAIEQDALYIYRIEQNDNHYTGLIACSDISDFLEGSIKKHENTLAAKEQKQMQLLLKRKAAVKPVLLTYPVIPHINEFFNTYIAQHSPVLDLYFESEDARHLIWAVREQEHIQYIQQLFEEHIPCTYIADGHHRTSTTALMYERHIQGNTKNDFHLLLSAFFPTTDIEILPFNRVILGFGEISHLTFMAKLSQLFDIETLKKGKLPAKKHELTMMADHEWFSLKWRPEVLKAYEKEEAILDAAILDKKVLKEILEIEDVRTDQRVKYVEGPKGIKGIEKQALKAEHSIAFCLYPIQMEEMIKLADAGKVLPPKSTWFEPRMKNGLIIHAF